MSFDHKLKQLKIEKKVDECLKVKEETILKTLQKESLTTQDLPILLSPVAKKHIESLAKKSQALTQKRFGKNIQLFIPLYLSNECYNRCTYCNFSMDLNYQRKTLNENEILKEGLILKEKGFKHILLLTGEAPNKAGVNYIKNAVKILNPHFDSIGIEVQPLSQKDYTTLIEAGVDKLTLYQETYHKETYLKHHLSGKKRNVSYRLNAVESAAKANIPHINIGALLGLYDWRYDCLALAEHLSYLQKKYWKIKYAVSFPRITETIHHYKTVFPISISDLTQVITSFRLIFPDIAITLSTRENESTRNGLIPLGITTLSAESKTAPGGYQNTKETPQFQTHDTRSLETIKTLIKSKGYDPIMKDWQQELTSIKN